jgi:hypothetical protein
MTLYQPGTNRQLPDNAILDRFDKQTYLGNSYMVPITLSLGSTSETPIVLIENPLTLTFPTQKSLFINFKAFDSSAEAALVKLYVNPTVSSTSTASTPVNLRPASSNVSISSTYANGQFSVSGNGTLVQAIGCATGNVPVIDPNFLVIVDPGGSFLATVTALVSTTSFNFNVSWYEI